MMPSAGCRAGHVGALPPHGGMQPSGQVRRQEGCVRRDRQDPARVRRVGGRPGHPGQHAGERAGLAGQQIGGDRQAEAGEARRIAVGVQDQPADLRRDPLDGMGKQRPSGERAQALVAAAHAARPAAGKQNADGNGIGASGWHGFVLAPLCMVAMGLYYAMSHRGGSKRASLRGSGRRPAALWCRPGRYRGARPNGRHRHDNADAKRPAAT